MTKEKMKEKKDSKRFQRELKKLALNHDSLSNVEKENRKQMVHAK